MTDMFDEQNRSRLLMLGGGALALALGGFVYFAFFATEPIEGKVLTSPEQCASFGSVAAEDCTQLFRNALILHDNTAPAYATREACERPHGAGRCQLAGRSTVVDRQSKFVPPMAALMVATGPNGEPQVTPLYRDPGDGPDQWRQATQTK